MNNIFIQVPAKINLYLDVLGKRSDGYHNLKMIMQTISLFDDVYIKKIDDGIKVYCDTVGVPEDETNTAYKAAQLMINQFNLNQGVEIRIKKRIPLAAGLGGGSADAAGVIRGINRLFGLNLNLEDLMAIGKKVGADVPFCILGGTALAEGIGEFLTPLEPFSGVPIVLVKPHFGISTAEVYKKFDENEQPSRVYGSFFDIIEGIKLKDVNKVGRSLFNALEAVTAKEFPVIEEIKNLLIQNGAVGSLMSGSGSAVFGLFDNQNNAQKAYNNLKARFRSYLLKTL